MLFRWTTGHLKSHRWCYIGSYHQGLCSKIDAWTGSFLGLWGQLWFEKLSALERNGWGLSHSLFLIQFDSAHLVMSTFPAQSTLIWPPCIRSASLSTITSSLNVFPPCAGFEAIDLVVCALNGRIHYCRFVSLEFDTYHSPSISVSRSERACQTNTWNVDQAL